MNILEKRPPYDQGRDEPREDANADSGEREQYFIADSDYKILAGKRWKSTVRFAQEAMAGFNMLLLLTVHQPTQRVMLWLFKHLKDTHAPGIQCPPSVAFMPRRSVAVEAAQTKVFAILVQVRSIRKCFAQWGLSMNKNMFESIYQL